MTSKEDVVLLTFDQLLNMSRKYDDNWGKGEEVNNDDGFAEAFQENLEIEPRQPRNFNAKERKPEAKHSAQQTSNKQRKRPDTQQQNQPVRSPKMRGHSAQKPKRQDRALYQPKKGDRPVSSSQESNQVANSVPQDGPNARNKRPDQIYFASPRQQDLSPQSPLSHLENFEGDFQDASKPSPRTRKRPTQQIYVPKPRQQAMEQQEFERRNADQIPETPPEDASPTPKHDLRNKLNESRKTKSEDLRYSPESTDRQKRENNNRQPRRNDRRSEGRSSDQETKPQTQKPARNGRGNRSRRKPHQQSSAGNLEDELGNLSDTSHKSLEWDYQVEMAELAAEKLGAGEPIPPEPDDNEEWEDEEEDQTPRQRADPQNKGQRKKNRNKNRRGNADSQGDGNQNRDERRPENSNNNRNEDHDKHGARDGKKYPDRPGSGRQQDTRRSQEDERTFDHGKRTWDRSDRNGEGRKDFKKGKNQERNDGNGIGQSAERHGDNRKQKQSVSEESNFKGRGKKVDRGEDRKQDRFSEERRTGGGNRHGGGGGARRRLHSEGSQSSEPPETPPDKNLGLKVTFGEAERRVKMDGENHSRQRPECSPRGRKDSERNESQHHSTTGGLLYLPHGDSNASSGHRTDARHAHPAAMPSRGSDRPTRGSSRGRGNTHRTLYDPKNPTKHTRTNNPSQLQFQDVYEGDSGAYPAGYPDYERSLSYDYSRSGQPPTHGFYDPQIEYSGSPSGHADGFYNYGYPASPAPLHDSGTYHDDTYSRDPYYHRKRETLKDRLCGYDQEMATGREDSAAHTQAQSILRDLTPLDSQLNNILCRGVCGEEGMRKVLSLRQELQRQYEQVILLDIDLANKHNIEQMLWKSAFYQIIEFLRKNTLDALMGESYKQHLTALLEEGTNFYEGLLKNLQTKASFNIEDYLDASQPAPETEHRKVKLALLSAQRTMICLGDIARYKEQANHTSNYGKARSWYIKAQQLAPKNGRPYNQLAILALYTKRKLDAVYYYMRSLAASNPFLTARESVLQLFDEARKKAAATERKKEEDKQKRERMLRDEMKREDGNRTEIWISQDGKSSEGRVVDALENELDFISTVELNKRFVLNFMNVHGKLFTKIGMESFEEVSCQMLQEFSALIQHTPPPIGNNRLLQLMCTNMFAIDNTAPKDLEAMDENCRSLTQEQAVQIGLEMFGLLAARCVLLLEEHLLLGDFVGMSEDLHQLFPSVKVWSDWMMCHVTLWNPPPLQRDPSSGMVVPVWQNLADLCNILKKVDTSHVKLYTQKKEGCDQVILNEDVMMAGFVPLLSLSRLPTYVHQLVDKEIARDCLRVDRLMTFGDYLCGIEPPMLSYNVATNQYVSIAPDSVQSEAEEEPKVQNISADDLDVIIESEEEVSELNTSSGDENFRELRKKHEQLKKQMEEKQRHDETVEAVLQRHSEKTIRPIRLEIRPIFLVPDTNGFIDHLDTLRKLVDGKKFTIVVPIVVLNELDGLAKGSRVGQYDSVEHAEMVRNNAEAAVRAVEAEFAARNAHWKAMTSKGSMMDTIAFRSEETLELGSNDDLILECCLHFCKDKARDFMPKDRVAAITLYRDVVLLTDDRNLRLKAHMRNVPVKDIPAFQRWAKVS